MYIGFWLDASLVILTLDLDLWECDKIGVGNLFTLLTDDTDDEVDSESELHTMDNTERAFRWIYMQRHNFVFIM